MRELGNAMTYMLSARELLDLALPRMKRLAADFFEGKDRALIVVVWSANLTVGLFQGSPSSGLEVNTDQLTARNVLTALL